jgi:hypothetical protein
MRSSLVLSTVVSLFTLHNLFYCANIQIVVRNLYEQDYKNVTREMWRYIRNGTGLLRISGNHLSLSCTADVQITWKWTEDGVNKARINLKIEQYLSNIFIFF